MPQNCSKPVFSNQSETGVVAKNSKPGSFFRPQIQYKSHLSVNEPNDVYEQEADAVADQVVRMPGTSLQSTFFKPASFSIRRKCAHCEAEEQQLQRKETAADASADNSTEQYVTALSGGSSLNESQRSFFQGRMGYDFNNVRIHNDTRANESAKSLNALAYTHGNNIVFASGQYRPEADEGKKLLAHELTHVVQQQSAAIQRAPTAAAANWWDDKSIGIRPQSKFWDDMRLFFPKDSRKFSGSRMDNVTNIECDDSGMVSVGKAYWDESDGLKRKAWIQPMIEKRDVKRYDEGRIDNEDLTNDNIITKLKALTGDSLKSYITKLGGFSTVIKNDQVIAFLNADDKGKTQIVAAENEKLLDWKFDNNRLTDAELKDEKTNTRLRGLSTSEKLDKETKAKEFAEKTGEATSKLQSFLHAQTVTSTPVPDDGTIDSAGGFTMHLTNVDIIVLSDTSGGKGNETSFTTNLPTTPFQFNMDSSGLITEFFRMNGKIKVSVTIPSKLVFTIQTRYQDISNVDQSSAYGKGTTAQDIQWGAKTLRFHEGSHGKGFIDYIRSHTFPSLAIGSVRQADFKSISDMTKEMNVESCTLVDQVGTTQDAFLLTPEGKASGLVSCTK